ncbi:MAG: hypothetical protein Q9169_003866 [Polycauliona sp. 2 TL-2023]
MVYIMKMSVDGACRNNGYSNATAAAACVAYGKWGGTWKTWSRLLPSWPRPTNQAAELTAAELTAVIITLEKAVARYNELSHRPFMKVTITTDSRYVHGCMTKWRFKWENNGWKNAAGRDVANRDLLERALELMAEVEENGHVEYAWVPREQNTEADEAANRELDEAAQYRHIELTSSSSDEGW